MQIALHMGAACTDDDRLLKTLLKNTDSFAKEGIKIPGPGKYRRLIRETIQNLQGAEPAPETRDILVDAILDDESANRLVLSNSAFICVPNRVFEDRMFYPQAAAKVAGFGALFPDDDIELFLGLRNPATFVPATFEKGKTDNFAEFLAGIQTEQLVWSHVVETIRQALPRASLTVWCNEDTPLIWAQLVREISGVDPLTQISGGFDLLTTIISKDGMARLSSYLKSHPPQTEVQKRRIVAAFLERYALEEEIIEEMDLPGWTEEVVDHLTEQYEEDVYRIERMQGVTFIGP